MNAAENQQSLRFLCLEDDVRDRQILEETLESEGVRFEIVYAKTQKKFQAALEENRFDLILSDFSLPSYNGMSALAAAQKLQPETPFIFVSGTIGEERTVEILKSGATDYVLKTHLDRLGSAVQRALREAKERQGRKLAEQSLKESEARFRQVADNVDGVFWLADTRTDEMLYINPAYEKVWGRSREGRYQKPRSWLETVHPADRDRVSESAAVNQVEGTYDETYRIVRPDGSIRWVRERVYPIRDEAGEVYRLVGTAEDVTEQRALEEQLRQAQKMEAIGQLAGGVAHDFNNLLTIIRGNAELALMDVENLQNGDKIRDCLAQVTAASGRAANLTRQLLAFSRKQVIQTQQLDLNEVIANLAKMLNRIIGEDVQLKCDYSPAPAFVQADLGMMEQVVVNLVVNARDAMPNGGQLDIAMRRIHFDKLRAPIHPEPKHGEFICLIISDTGTGIAPEHLPHIFEPFFTTKEASKGTGLGLATVYGIVKQHQGWVEVSSRLEAGSTFKVFLPALPMRTAPAPSTPANAALRGGNEEILLVEDDPAVRLLTRRTLETFGYRVWEVGSGQEALELWNSGQANIQLLLTDLVMPGGLTGRELGKRLREKTPALKIVYMSGYSPDITGKDAEAIQREMSYYLQKPYSNRALIEIIRRCLDEKG